MILDTLADRRVFLFGGKGGVGKTTISAKAALELAESRRVILFTTDPASNLGDLFDRPVSNLTLEALDASALYARFLAANLDAFLELGDRGTYLDREELRRFFELSLPGVDELMAWMRIGELAESNADATIVVDTAPTGHTLQLLRMPEAMTTWIQALVKHRRALLEIDRGSGGEQPAVALADPILAALERRHERLAQLRVRVTDRGWTSFVLVTIPERLAIEETARAADLLSDTNVDIGGLVVNRILPEGLAGEFYVSRKAQERSYLDEIARRFERLRRVEVRQLARDVYGLKSLTLISDQLMQ